MRKVFLANASLRGRFEGCTLGRPLRTVKVHQARVVAARVSEPGAFGGEPVPAELLEQPLTREAEGSSGARLVPPRAFQSLAQTPLFQGAGLGMKTVGPPARGLERARPVLRAH